MLRPKLVKSVARTRRCGGVRVRPARQLGGIRVGAAKTPSRAGAPLSVPAAARWLA